MTEESSGGRVGYYLVTVDHPQREEQGPYQAECEDIIAALGMTFAEGCEFKAIWRTAAARQGRKRAGTTPVRDAEKRVYYAQYSLKQERIAEACPVQTSDKDGWVEWDGGNWTLNPECEVEVQFRNGVLAKYFAKEVRWKHLTKNELVELRGWDIVKYKFQL